MADPLLDIFKTGIVLSFSSNDHFSLEKKGTLWFLQKGSVNLFAIRPTEKETPFEGPRTLIASFSAPALLCSLQGAQDHSIFAICEETTSLFEMQIKDLSFPLQEQPEFASLLNHWILTLSTSINSEWASPLPQDKAWAKKLEEFHLFFLEGFFAQQREKAELEQRHWEEKKKKDEELFHDVLGNMVSLLDPEFSPAPLSSAPSDLLFRACQHIGNFLHLLITPLEKSLDTLDLPSQLEIMVQSWGIRVRPVTLTAMWWKQGTDPFLAFHGKEKTPVALLPHSPGRYKFFSPSSSKGVAMNRQIASSLQKTAYVFYRPFPEELTSWKEIFFLFLRRHRREFYWLIFYSGIASLFALFAPFALGALFGHLVPRAEASLIEQVTAMLFLTSLGAGIFFLFRTLALVRLDGLAANQIQLSLWDRFLRLPVSFSRRFSTGNLLLKILSAEQSRLLLSGRAMRALFGGLFSLFYLLAMAFFSVQLAAIALLFSTFILTITSFSAVSCVRLEKKKYNLKAKINSAIIQIIAGVGRFRVAGAESNAFSYWASLYTAYKKLDMREQSLKNRVIISSASLPILSLFFFFFYLIINEGADSIGSFLGFYAAFIPFSIALLDLSNTCLQVISAFLLPYFTKDFLEEKQEMLIKKMKPGVLRGEVSIDQVSFSYRKESSSLLLENVSLRAEPGEFIAIAGPSGSGKSTLIRLLLGFEEPSSGAIYFDGKDLKTLDLQEVRKQIGSVLQTGGILSGTLYDNLVCSRSYTKEQIEQALRLSGFQKDVDSFPMGLKTIFTPGAETFAGGQKQRFLIARALLCNPRLLILDEATSTLESKSQEEIELNIEQLNITRIVIAHRLSTIKNADRIYVLEKGKIAQVGTFQQLAKEEGLFSRMLFKESATSREKSERSPPH